MKKTKVGKFKIEKGIPIPPKANGTGATAVIRSLKVGESVELPNRNKSVTQLAHQIYGKGHVVVRATEKGCRIWRIK